MKLAKERFAFLRFAPEKSANARWHPLRFTFGPRASQSTTGVPAATGETGTVTPNRTTTSNETTRRYRIMQILPGCGPPLPDRPLLYTPGSRQVVLEDPFQQDGYWWNPVEIITANAGRQYLRIVRSADWPYFSRPWLVDANPANVRGTEHAVRSPARFGEVNADSVLLQAHRAQSPGGERKADRGNHADGEVDRCFGRDLVQADARSSASRTNSDSV